ncbi:hypothetical protein DSM104440_00626 [Usitatibacter palustris]|uniref:Uncharacterized protein n=1 Tax=Usitatibacter palustris TaxID=2732487 RepID=A0A6M4H2T3_9PROT|nr:hypothetical protein DSM104440_00626 [Usitatibacter palustris]
MTSLASGCPAPTRDCIAGLCVDLVQLVALLIQSLLLVVRGAQHVGCRSSNSKSDRSANSSSGSREHRANSSPERSPGPATGDNGDLTCGINKAEWVGEHVGVRVDSAFQPDGIALNVSSNLGVVVPEVVVVARTRIKRQLAVVQSLRAHTCMETAGGCQASEMALSTEGSYHRDNDHRSPPHYQCLKGGGQGVYEHQARREKDKHNCAGDRPPRPGLLILITGH